MSEINETRVTWSEILKAIQAKTKQDYTSRVVPAIHTGRTTLGSWIVTVGQKIQSSK